jgi:hypothetical protein
VTLQKGFIHYLTLPLGRTYSFRQRTPFFNMHMYNSLGLKNVKPSMTIRSESEISEAIRICAQECLDGKDAHECVKACGEKLLAEGWDEADVKQVQIGTLYVLSYLKKDDSLLPKREQT